MELRRELPSRHPVSPNPHLSIACQGTGPCKAWSSNSKHYQRICGGCRWSLLFPSLILAWWTMLRCPGAGFCAAGAPAFHTGGRAERLTFCRLETSHSMWWRGGRVFTLLPQPKSALINCIQQPKHPPHSLRGGLSSLPLPVDATHHPAWPRQQWWSAPAPPPQHLRCSKENICNCPTALWLFLKLSVHLKVSSQAREGSQEWKANGGQLSSTLPSSCQHQPTLSPRAGPV